MRCDHVYFPANSIVSLLSVMQDGASAEISVVGNDGLRQVRRREGRYPLRTNLTETDPVKLWHYYLQLVQVEEAFRTLKSDLAIRPNFHQDAERIEAQHALVHRLPGLLLVRDARTTT
jgi:hypothetical protein